jgi:hypothetical protein
LIAYGEGADFRRQERFAAPYLARVSFGAQSASCINDEKSNRKIR